MSATEFPDLDRAAEARQIASEAAADRAELKRFRMALVEILEWYDDLPNDTFEAMPPCIRRARKLIPEREK
jgi:hypothetical protein